ncbi:MAG: ThuA domain-containing protein, partial [Anaerolineae bacterium]|nr:ThuA domain-containing protein [Anaerolineae bacterium]
MTSQLHVTVWNEYRHERKPGKPAEIYPQGLHTPIAAYLREQGMDARTATLDEPEHGLTDSVLAQTDVLTWWGHMAHDDVSDAIVEKVHQRIVLGGMGLVVLHSGHFSKIFRRLMGTTCDLKWRDDGEKERVWVIEPGHPIAAGLPGHFEVPLSEMYGERFDIPQPDELIFASWFQGGEIFRSGCTFRRGKGRIFYFSPGHEV